jgi:phage-related tail fiber protein
MAAYEGLQLTSGGLVLLSRAHLGTQLSFVRVAVGDGTLPVGETPEQRTAMVNERKNATINSWANLGNGTARLRVTFSNETETLGWAAREIGVFVSDPDNVGQEVLYAYATAGDRPDWLPAYGGESVVEHVVDLLVVVLQASSVSVTLTTGSFVTVADLAETDDNVTRLQNDTRLLAHFMR